MNVPNDPVKVPSAISEPEQDPSLNEALRRDPRQVSDDELLRLINQLRMERALFIKGGRV